MEQNGEVAFVQEDYTQKHSSVENGRQAIFRVSAKKENRLMLNFGGYLYWHDNIKRNSLGKVLSFYKWYSKLNLEKNCGPLKADMFSDLDLTAVIKEYGHTSSEWLINWIVENMSTLPKKQQGVKRKAETSMLAESFDQVESDVVSSDEEENIGSLVRDVMLGEMLTALKSEIHKTPCIDAEKYWDLRELLLDIFPTARAEFIKRIVNVFKGRFVACALACFFVENKHGSKVQKYAPELNQAFWIKASKPTNTKRKPKKLATQECADEMKPELERYQQVIETFHKKYPEMFEDGKLSKESAQIELDSSNSENKLECPVCLENMPASKMICCNIDSNVNLSSFDQPSTSSERASESVSRDVAGDQSGIVHEDFSAHTFCRACVRCHAVAATHEIPLADGGVGLKCMVPGCKNPILYSEIRHLLKNDTKKKLDERIIEENLGLASLKNLERCHKCNFPIEMDVPPEVNKVFDCPSCNHQFCRLCKSDWDDDHIGITCDELSVKLKKDRKDRNIEQLLNEAIIRKCPQCSIAFTKSEGCNKMTCRCGCTQCYICRETNIKYTHFCQHFRDPANKEAKCKQCDKTCLLWEDSKKLDDQIIENIKKQQQQVQQTNEQPAQSSSAFGEREVNAAIDSFLVPLLPNNFANYAAPQLPAGGAPFLSRDSGQQFHRHRPAPDIFADNFGHFDNLGNPFFDADVAEWVNTGGRNRSLNPANQQLQQQLGNPYQPYNNYYDQQPWRNNPGAPFTQDYVNPYAPVQHQQIPQKYGFQPPAPYQMPQNVAPQHPQNPYIPQAPADQGTSRGRRNKAAKPNKYVEAVYNPQVNTFQMPNPGAIPAAAVANNAGMMNPQEGAAEPAYPAANGQASQGPQIFVGLMMPPVDNAIAEFDEFLLNYANNPNKDAFQKRHREAQMKEWRQKAQQDGQQQPGGSGLNSAGSVGGSGQNNTTFFDHTGNNNQ